MKKILLLLLLSVPLCALAQDLTGTWIGKGGGTTYIKLVIRHTKDTVFGYTYDEAIDDSWCRASFHGKYDKGALRLVGYGGVMIEQSGSHGTTTYNWRYSKEADGEYLRENLGARGLLDQLLGSRGEPQWLRRVSNKPQKLDSTMREVRKLQAPKPEPKPAPKPPAPKPKPEPKPAPKPPVPKPVPPVPKPVEPEKKIEPVKPAEPPVIVAPQLVKAKKERSSKLVRTILTEADSIRLFIYDNGEIDNDTVTVFYDDQVVLNKYMITDKAKVITLPISKDREHVVELFANNLGTIPPNTALVVIVAGKKRYELFASYDLKTNAKIVFRYGKEE